MNSTDKATMIAFCALFICMMVTISVVVACNTVFDSEIDVVKKQCVDYGYAEWYLDEDTRIKTWRLIPPK